MTRIHFHEVVTRDGFPMEPEFVATEAKVALIDALSGCGYAKIEVTSFTSAKAIPMLRDAEEVMGRIRRAPGVQYAVLVPNPRGAERALDVGVRIAQPREPAHGRAPSAARRRLPPGSRPRSRRAALDDIERMLEVRVLRHTIGLTLPLAQTAEAHRLLEQGEVMGNVVLAID